MIEALAVTRHGPGLYAKARTVADRILYRYHRQGSYAEAVNSALCDARNPVVLKIDDDDYYPSDHGEILGAWEPGVVLYGFCEWRGCDGSYWGHHPSLCASAFGSDIRVSGDQITGSVLRAGRVVEVETGVTKKICPARWSWGVFPPYYSTIECDHAVR